MQALRHLLIAVQFLTRVPIPGWVGFAPDWLNRAAGWFPLVGALVGAFGALVLWGTASILGPTLAAILAVIATVALTGAFHEDGLADTFDALGGTVSRERALIIMKDSRIGTYGACALVLVLALRIATLAALLAIGPAFAAAALIASHALGRAASVGVMAMLPYAGALEDAKAKPLAVAVPRSSVVLAAASGLGLLIACLAFADRLDPLLAGAAIGASLAVMFAMRRWLARRLGGYTGDTLGATEQLAEVGVLLALLAATTA